MKLNRVSGILSVAVLAGLWGCSSQKQVAQQYVYDDLYANSSDVRAVAYSNKRSGTVERVQPGEESVVTRGQAQTGTDEYYSPELSAGNYKRGQPGYSNQDYDAGYADGFYNAQRTAGWNNVGWNSWNRWNSWNNWGWGGGFGGWGWNNWMSPGISIGLGWGRPWGWGGFYDPFWGGMGGWGWNNWGWGGGMGGWGWNDWAWGGRPWGWGSGFGGWGWGGRNRVWINNNYYGNTGTGGGNGVVTNPGTNYSRPRTRADYDRYQAAYNEDAYRSNATRNGQRAGADANSYYSRPRQDYGSPSWNGRNSSGGSGSYSRGSYSQPSYSNGNQNRSSGWDNSWSNRGSSSGFENRSSGSSNYGGSSGGSYGGGGGRSRGPR